MCACPAEGGRACRPGHRISLGRASGIGIAKADGRQSRTFAVIPEVLRPAQPGRLDGKQPSREQLAWRTDHFSVHISTRLRLPDGGGATSGILVASSDRRSLQQANVRISNPTQPFAAASARKLFRVPTNVEALSAVGPSSTRCLPCENRGPPCRLGRIHHTVELASSCRDAPSAYLSVCLFARPADQAYERLARHNLRCWLRECRLRLPTAEVPASHSNRLCFRHDFLPRPLDGTLEG